MILPTKRPQRSILRRIRLLLLDVDGVMTDGGIYYSGRGEELKKFNTKDGHGIVKIQKMGIQVGIITGRVSKIVATRAEELEITEVHQNQHNKIATYNEIKKRLKLTDSQIAYVGDDEPDLATLRIAGFSAAPADASPIVLRAVDFVCSREGGNGAVREVIDLLLGARS